LDFATRDAFSITTRNEKRILQQESISLSEPVGRLSKYHTKNGRLKKNRTQQRTTLYVGLYYHIPARPLRYSNTSQLSVPRVRKNFSSAGFSVAAPGTHSHLAFMLVHHHIHSVVFLKPTVSTRPSVPPIGSHKCPRFGLWLTLRTINDFTYLLTYIC